MTNSSPHYIDLKAKYSLRDTANARFYLEKLVDGRWVRTGLALGMAGAEQHASAIGGEVRALGKGGEVAASWVEGVRQ